MTREQLEAVYDELVSNLGSSNQAAADDDRGPANDTFAMTLYDDGSGSIGRRTRYEGPEGHVDETQDFYDFTDFESLVKALQANGCEIEGETP